MREKYFLLLKYALKREKYIHQFKLFEDGFFEDKFLVKMSTYLRTEGVHTPI
jgi:hypothetical protein